MRLLDPVKNDGIDATQVIGGGSDRILVWTCEAGHDTSRSVYAVTIGTPCGVCTNKVLLAGVNDLATTNPDLAAEIIPAKNGGLSAQEILGGNSGKTFVWTCPAGHDTTKSVRARAKAGCGVCSNHIVLAGFNDLATTNPALAKELDPTKNAGIDATQITGGMSDKKFVWTCAAGHDTRQGVNKRTLGARCPRCFKTGISRVEEVLYESLREVFSDATSNPVIPLIWGTHKSARPDIAWTWNGRKFIAEYDGWYYHHAPINRARDLAKTSALLADGYYVIRVREGALADVNISHRRLTQMNYRYRTGTDTQLAAFLVPVVDSIVDFVHLA